jgi:hypothetical protein
VRSTLMPRFFFCFVTVSFASLVLLSWFYSVVSIYSLLPYCSFFLVLYDLQTEGPPPECGHCRAVQQDTGKKLRKCGNCKGCSTLSSLSFHHPPHYPHFFTILLNVLLLFTILNYCRVYFVSVPNMALESLLFSFGFHRICWPHVAVGGKIVKKKVLSSRL